MAGLAPLREIIFFRRVGKRSISWTRLTGYIPAWALACWNRPTKPFWRSNWRVEACAWVRQQAIPIIYHGTRIEMGFRADLIVADLVIVEIKSVETVAPVHKKQVLTHLRLAGKRLGLLINFNVALIKDGITRIANGMPD